MKTSPASNHGPHGGPLLALESGFVEFSVFETGVPPVFRLYFSNQNRQPQSDIAVEVDPALSIREADAIGKNVEQAVRDHVHLLDSVVVRVCPARE